MNLKDAKIKAHRLFMKHDGQPFCIIKNDYFREIYGDALSYDAVSIDDYGMDNSCGCFYEFIMEW